MNKHIFKTKGKSYGYGGVVYAIFNEAMYEGSHILETIRAINDDIVQTCVSLSHPTDSNITSKKLIPGNLT